MCARGAGSIEDRIKVSAFWLGMMIVAITVILG